MKVPSDSLSLASPRKEKKKEQNITFKIHLIKESAEQI
jgi:hypothetical protein